MLNENSGVLKVILSILLFPMYFQGEFIIFAWGAGDPEWMIVLKRLFLLLPVLAFILGCWLSIASFLTVIVRQNRKDFITALFVTWWDLGKAVVAFWGGIFYFVFNLIASLFGLLKIIIFGVWTLIQDILFLPFRLLGSAGKNVVRSQVPWIAVFLTLLWCIIETTIFTYVTAPLVIDVFSNITGTQFAENFVRIPLFIFLLFIILGSYAVLSTFVDSVKSKNVGSILGVGVIEVIVLFVEVIFLYREFVDALVPWLAQYSENFQLGIIGTLAISTFVWFGIRSLSWFLFAAHGTPTIMAVIQGKGIKVSSGKVENQPGSHLLTVTSSFLTHIKEDTAWIQRKGEELLASFMLPPLQVIAAAINFCTLLVTADHLFQVPFKNIEDITESRMLLARVPKKEGSMSFGVGNVPQS